MNQFAAAPSSVQFSPIAYAPLMKYMRKPPDDAARYQQRLRFHRLAFFYYCNFAVAPAAAAADAS